LNNGTSFHVYKRYLDQTDIRGWLNQYDAEVSIEHFGTAFFAVSGTFTHGC